MRVSCLFTLLCITQLAIPSAAGAAAQRGLKSSSDSSSSSSESEEDDESDDDVQQRIDQCLADPASLDIVEQWVALDMERQDNNLGWYLPTPPTPGLPIQNEYALLLPNGQVVPESFEWLAQGLPTTFSEDNAPNYPGLPPPAEPGVLFFRNQMKPFFNNEASTPNWGYKKFHAAPFWVLSFFNKDPATFRSSTDPATTVFLTNLEDRGPNNFLKKQYMSAVTCDKMPYYQPKVDAAIEGLLDDILTDEKPILSAWFNRVLDLFFDIHVGTTDVPDYVEAYFREFMESLSDNVGGSLLGLNNDSHRLNFCRNPLVEEYFEARRQIVVEEEDESTFLYWWNVAEFPPERNTFEAIHNILAFVQYVNTLFLLLRAKIPLTFDPTLGAAIGGGYISIKNAAQGQQLPPPSLDFFAKYDEAKNAHDENERLNVAREAYRILLPNNNWLSQVKVDQAAEDNADALLPDADLIRSFHIPIFIQAMNDNYNQTSLDTDFGIFDTSRYADFDTSLSKCPVAGGLAKNNPTNLLETSDLDGETIVPKQTEKLIPIFPAGDRDTELVNGPKYCAFGLGYRRCPGEILNMVVMETLLDKLSGIPITMGGDPALGLGPSNLFIKVNRNDPNFGTAVSVAPNARVRDNLFVDTTALYPGI